MTLKRHAYGFGTRVDAGFDATVQRTTELLKAEGFGVLTTIDVQKTLREKLGAEFRRYVILGACNPPLAHRALQAELELGLLLPCHVIVYEDGDGTAVSFMDAGSALEFVGNPALEPVGREARERLERVAARLGEGG